MPKTNQPTKEEWDVYLRGAYEDGKEYADSHPYDAEPKRVCPYIRKTDLWKAWWRGFNGEPY